ncbi:MAG: AraC family transcriptional regulator [Oleiphilus sp.]|nr:MAG: AraC family transcriptional regulator [Oleiphilus sp.]
MKHLGFASVSAVKQYLRYADAHQIATDPLIAIAGISPELLTENNGRIMGQQFQTLLRALIETADDPLLGLNSSQFVQAQSYNVLGTITLHCKTLGEAIERIPPFERLVGDMGTTTIQRNSREIIQSWHCIYPDPIVQEQMVDNVLASWTLFARRLAQKHASARRIELMRQTPAPKLASQYEAFFDCPVLFEQPENRIYMDHSLLEVSLKGSDGGLLHQLEGQARSQLGALRIEDESFTEQVTRSIRAHLQLGSVRKELIAQEFNICERTIQRRLNAEGTRFQTLLEGVRYQRACELLQQTGLSIQDIAFNIGYTDVRCFFRSFRKWTGTGPAEYRQSVGGKD